MKIFFELLLGAAVLETALSSGFTLPSSTFANNFTKRANSIKKGQGKEWPDGHVKVRFTDRKVETDMLPLFKAAFDIWAEGVPSLRWSIDQNDKKALFLEENPGKGALTTVGYTDSEKANHMLFSLSNDYGLFDRTANMVHEIGHALGLVHEHQRPDAHKVVKFKCENLADYEKVKESTGRSDEEMQNDLCVNRRHAGLARFSAVDFILFDEEEYDYTTGDNKFDLKSIMMYPSSAGGKGEGNNRKNTLTLKPFGRTIRPNTRPSVQDFERLKHLYGTGAGSGRVRPKPIHKTPPKNTAPGKRPPHSPPRVVPPRRPGPKKGGGKGPHD